MKITSLFFVLILFFGVACKEEASIEIAKLDRTTVSSMDTKNNEETFLHLIPPSTTGISFKNIVKTDEYRNFKSYKQIYNGGGVAVGDLNGDGLSDLYFAGNSADDKIYINKGDLKFEDYTEKSGIKKYTGGWSYGVVMVDINADGLLDIYVSKAGPYKVKAYLKNKLFVNQGDGTFLEEAAKYGLDIDKFSVHSSFFDYDLDGDLDMYLINHPAPGEVTTEEKNLMEHVLKIRKGVLRTDNFYENVNGKYVDKSEAVGILNYGFKNGLAVSDLNKDGYPDIYVCTDYGEPDLYYINNGDKTFTNAINEKMKHITYNSMGVEFADINNDAEPDVYVMDMTPDDHVRSKQLMASMNAEKFNAFVSVGFHHQYMVNSLQINNGDGSFSEQAQQSGIAKTDWSWAPLFFDIDLDGNKDLYVTNGIVKNTNDNDIGLRVKEKQGELKRKLNLFEFLDLVPSDITDNRSYKNEDGLHFTETTTQWIDNPSFNSNGAVYSDLDNDGDLDLVVSNLDAIASVYEKRSPKNKTGNSITIQLKGLDQNTMAQGAKVEIPLDGAVLYHEHFTSRGYLSSVDPKIVIGVGTATVLPEINITWPDGAFTQLKDIPVNSSIKVEQGNGTKQLSPKSEQTLLQKLDPKKAGLAYTHKEDKIDDFKEQILLPYSVSQNGPFMASADVNGDGLEDVYVGGASKSPGKLYIQSNDGSFVEKEQEAFIKDKKQEDLGVVFLDYNNDGHQDLYVTSGGAAFKANSNLYQDRVYKNDGKGNFTKDQNALSSSNVSTQVVVSNDIDGDGDADLFVGGRVIPDKYPFAPKSSLLINDNGVFKDQTAQISKDLEYVGLITGAVFSDYDSDGDKDLIVVGEWTPITVFENNNGNFSKKEVPSLAETDAIWWSIYATDLDNDGDDDYLVGNLGLNSKFTAKEGKPFHVYCDDFDNNGTYDIVFSKDYKGELVPMRGRECSSQQMPFILDKFANYESFATANLEEMLGEDKMKNALHYQAYDFKSIALINDGGGNFRKIALPAAAQVAPIMKFTEANIDGKEGNEIIAIGNLYPTEVETTRYDASQGVVMQFDGDSFTVLKAAYTGLRGHGDAKDALIIKAAEKDTLLLVTNNDSDTEVYKFKK